MQQRVRNGRHLNFALWHSFLFFCFFSHAFVYRVMAVRLHLRLQIAFQQIVDVTNIKQNSLSITYVRTPWGFG